MQTHLDSETHAYTEFARIEMADGSVLGVTNHNDDVTIGAVTYKAAEGFTPTAVEARDDMAPTTVDIEGLIDANVISRADVEAGVYNNAKIFVFITRPASAVVDETKLLAGIWGEVKLIDDMYTTTFRSLAQYLKENIGDVFSVRCRADLGDSECTKDLALFTFSGTITGVTSDRLFADSGRTEADDYFSLGLLRWFTGNNAGDNAAITSATVANPVVLTSAAHGLVSGEKVFLDIFTGDYAALNSIFQDGTSPYVVTVVDANTFSVPVDSSLFSAYSGNGGHFSRGRQMETKNFINATGTFELVFAMESAVQVGDQYTAHRGCDKELSTCLSPFNNVVNHQAEPYVPGMDSIMETPNAR